MTGGPETDQMGVDTRFVGAGGKQIASTPISLKPTPLQYVSHPASAAMHLIYTGSPPRALVCTQIAREVCTARAMRHVALT